MIDENRPRVVGRDGGPSARPTEQKIPDARAASSSGSAAAEDAQLSARVRPADARASASLLPGRLAMIRRRILQGAYDRTEVLEVVARRILASGDLQVGS